MSSDRVGIDCRRGQVLHPTETLRYESQWRSVVNGLVSGTVAVFNGCVVWFATTGS